MSAPVSVDVLTVGPAHADILAVLHAEAFDHPWDAAAFARLLAQSGVFALLATEQDEPQGFALLRVAADEVEVLTVATRPQARSRGVGRWLMAAALDRARRMGAVRAFLEVAEDNASARALYAKLGFAEVGRRRDYYDRADGRQDALALARDLTGDIASHSD